MDFLGSRRLSLDSIGIATVIEYLTSLFQSGLAYRTITLHRSALSASLPLFDGHSVGNHPLVSRLVRAIFQQRPPTRRLFPSWDMASVFLRLFVVASSFFCDASVMDRIPPRHGFFAAPFRVGVASLRRIFYDYRR